MWIRILSRFSAGAFALLLAGLLPGGCSTGPSRSLPPSPSLFYGTSKPRPNYLYVANASTVTIYTPEGTALVRTITHVSPAAIALDRSGDLYIADVPSGTSGTVKVYAPGSSSPKIVISDGIHYPNALAVSASERLFVSNYYARATVYAPRTTSPLYAAKTGLFSVDLRLDSNGTLYDAQNQGPYGGRSSAVAVFPFGKRLATLHIQEGVNLPVAVALDSQRNVYVANSTNVTVYAHGSTKLLRTIKRGLLAPQALAVDPTGRLYVADSIADTVTVYAPHSNKLISTIRQGINQPKALTLDGFGPLYVANRNSVTVYDTESFRLAQTIRTGVDHPVAVRFTP